LGLHWSAAATVENGRRAWWRAANTMPGPLRDSDPGGRDPNDDGQFVVRFLGADDTAAYPEGRTALPN